MPKPLRKPEPRSPITAPIQMLIEAARKKQARHHHKKLGINHWVCALRDVFPILPRDLAWNEMKTFEMKSRLTGGEPGAALSVPTALARATKLAKGAGLRAPTIDELALTILDEAGLLPEETEAPDGATSMAAEHPGPDLEALVDAGPGPEPEPHLATPVLQRFGRDLTAEAAAGFLSPVIGRQEELTLLVETLCRRTRRNTALVGPRGVGKRAIVEGLAQKIAGGRVPGPLAGLRVIEVQLPALLAGVNALPELDERFGQILIEARGPGIVIFFDELRTITPAGHDGLTLAISNQLKPAITRGEITCIVSGAEDDFMRFVELDASLRPWFEERFQPIRIEELTAEKTLEAIELISVHTRAMTGVTVPPAVQKWLVAFAGDLLRSHRFPGKAVDLLEQCVAHAVSKGMTKVPLAEAREVAERSIGIPADMESRLRRIAKLLSESGLLVRADREAIVDRLSVTLRSLDLMPVRPNATILLAGEAAVGGRALAETLADGIAGAPDRVIPLDLGLLTEPWDTRQLLGIAGSKGPALEDLPLHALIEAPWSVVLCENVDGCHAQVRTSVTRALSEGYFMDAKGKKIYMSDAVVVLTAPSVEAKVTGPMGFGAQAQPSDARATVARTFDSNLVNQMDLVITRLDHEADLVALARHDSLLADLTRRYRSRGLEITWDKTLVSWLRAGPQQNRTKRDWEQWADRSLATALIPHLPARRPAAPKRVVVKHEGESLVVDRVSPERSEGRR